TLFFAQHHTAGSMAQHGYGYMGGGGVDPNDLTMGEYNQQYQNNYNNSNQNSTGFSTGSALLQDDDLLYSLGSPTEAPQNMQGGGHAQNFSGMPEMSVPGFTQGIYAQQHGLPMDQSQINGFSNTPEGDPRQSPYVQNLSNQYRQMQQQAQAQAQA